MKLPKTCPNLLSREASYRHQICLNSVNHIDIFKIKFYYCYLCLTKLNDHEYLSGSFVFLFLFTNLQASILPGPLAFPENRNFKQQ